jgi:hypothetical protein
MAIYKIFSEKDTFISSNRPTQNFGRDEILEISNLSPDTTRTLIQFPQDQITNIIDNVIGENDFTSFLRLFLAEATIPSNYIIQAYPISSSWVNGLGRSEDEPITTLGNTWNDWTIPGGDFINPPYSQSFNNLSNKDINLDLTSLIKEFYSGSKDNYGVLLKHSDDIEGSETPITLKFFSMDTHTIYPPQLEFKWDDSLYNTTIPQITSSNFSSTITNNKEEFKENTVYDFRIKARDKYPPRQFTTSSVYTNTQALPSSSYWALKDAKTEEMIVDFDLNTTKISCDNDSNYFKVYMNGLEPERYYQILYKTILPNNEVIVIDDKTNYFKIVR